jgi:hypothetical protein
MGYIAYQATMESRNHLCRMVTHQVISNATDIEKELQWFKEILKARSLINSNKPTEYHDVFDVIPPHFNGSTSEYATFVNKHELDFEDRFLLILSMAPHIKPEILDVFLQRSESTQQIYTEFGGQVGSNGHGFLPTGETLMFILAGNDLVRRFSLHKTFDTDHIFSKESIVWLENVNHGESFLNGVITLSQEALDRFTTGQIRKPSFNKDFPAKILTVKMDWSDLVLNGSTQRQLRDIEIWLSHHKTLMKEWGMEKKLKPGYKALFFGPPGTGKSLTAALIGKKTGKDVYKIDLSAIVSKYIGETEKNLAKVFNKAENKDWILFFDEADALFGKRTSVNDAHDRYANQEVSYLLQRIEDYDGLVILASNLKSNMDEAFVRRFNAMINFPMPTPEERKLLWEKGFSRSCSFEDQVDINEISRRYDLSGGSIMNVIQHTSLKALERGGNIIYQKDLVEGIKKEYQKGERTL